MLMTLRQVLGTSQLRTAPAGSATLGTYPPSTRSTPRQRREGRPR